jgi:hypothetical protein
MLPFESVGVSLSKPVQSNPAVTVAPHLVHMELRRMRRVCDLGLGVAGGARAAAAVARSVPTRLHARGEELAALLEDRVVPTARARAWCEREFEG